MIGAIYCTKGGRERGWAGTDMPQEERDVCGPMLWEPTTGTWDSKGAACTWSRRLAALGAATWADISHRHTGRWFTWEEFKSVYGVEGERARDEYSQLKAELRGPQWAGLAERWRERAMMQGAPESETESDAEDWNRWRTGEWEVGEVLAARSTPECEGGWEYRIRWRGDYADSWESHNTVGDNTALQPDLHKAREERRVHTSFGAWLDEAAEAGTGDKGGGRARRAAARRARARLRLTGHTDMQDAWQLFLEYNQEAMRHEVMDNIEDLPAARGGQEGWTPDSMQTFYRGDVTTRVGEEGVSEEARVTSLSPHTPRERGLPAHLRVTEDTLDKREKEQELNKQYAREQGMTEFEETLPHTLPLHRIERQAAGQRVWKGHQGPGHELIRDGDLLADPVARLLLRYDDLESGGEVCTGEGVTCTMDAKERRVLGGEGAVQETAAVARVLWALHAAHHFTNAAALDGSKGQAAEDRYSPTAYGGTTGVEPYGRTQPGTSDVAASAAEERAAVGAGMFGGRLPSAWEAVDAETYAIFAYLRSVHDHATREGRARGLSGRELAEWRARTRTLILSDCSSALETIERAWRTSEAEGVNRRDRGGIIEAICRVRAELGIVVTVWVGAHTGVSPNAVADAAAKAHLGSKTMEPVTERVAEWVMAKPHLNEMVVKGQWEFTDRQAFIQHRLRAMEYVRDRLREGLPAGRTMAGQAGHTWADVARRAIQPAPIVDEEGQATKPSWEDLRAHTRVVSIVAQTRVGEVLQIPHGRTWQRRKQQEGEAGTLAREEALGCPACCAVRRGKGQWDARMPPALCDEQHVLTGTCEAIDDDNRQGIDDGVAKLQHLAAKETQRAGAQGTAAQQLSIKHITKVLQGARRATQRRTQGSGHTIAASDFACLQQLLAAALPQHEPCGQGGAQSATFNAARVDSVLRPMRQHAVLQVQAVVQKAHKEVHRRRQHEAGRGWLALVLRAWRETAQQARGARGGAPPPWRTPCTSAEVDGGEVRPRRSKRVRTTVNTENQEQEAVNAEVSEEDFANSYKLQLSNLCMRANTEKRTTKKTSAADLVRRIRAITTYWRVMQIKDKIRRRKQAESERRVAAPPEHTGAQASTSHAQAMEVTPPEDAPNTGTKRPRTINNYREARTYQTREDAPKRVRRRVQGTAVGIDLLQRLWGLHASDADDRRSSRKRPRTPRIADG